MKHLLKIGDYTKAELKSILELSEELQNSDEEPLKHKNILFTFEKPSLRTKVATEVAINHLGGHVIHIDPASFLGGNVMHAEPVYDNGFGGDRESLYDTVKNVSQWCDAIFARVYSHQILNKLAKYSEVPVVNALCNLHHPMQALADIYTIQEKYGRDEEVCITFVGDANNVAFSLIEIGLKFGNELRFSGPEKYYWSQEQLNYFADLASENGGSFMHTIDPQKAIKDSDVIYTDAFVSMGEEHQYGEKISHFEKYQVNHESFSQAKAEAGFMHCLPAHRGIEVTNDVMDHPNSWVYDQAKNRMVVSKGVFTHLIQQQ